MRIGLVKFINARPLDYGFRVDRKNGYTLIEDTPARLADMLLAGELDTALISSVEWIKNRTRLGACTEVGVCSQQNVRSILLIFSQLPENINSSLTEDTLPASLNRVYYDRGSRSSVGLLKILLYRNYGKIPEFTESDPVHIPSLVQNSSDSAGLLIGDSALAFESSALASRLLSADLATWWNRLEGLPFVFALWAYPISKPLPDTFFVESLRHGMEHLQEIIQDGGYHDMHGYFTRSLHYRLGEAEKESLIRYEAWLKQVGHI